MSLLAALLASSACTSGGAGESTAAAPAATAGADAPSEDAESEALRDAGSRFWVSAPAEPPARPMVLEILEGDHRDPDRPLASPSECGTGSSGWTVRFYTERSSSPRRLDAISSCEWYVTELDAIEGFLECDRYGYFAESGRIRGITVRRDDERVLVRLVGPWELSETSDEEVRGEHALLPTTPIALASELFIARAGSTASTTMGQLFDAGFFDPPPVAFMEEAVRDAGFDPLTIPLRSVRQIRNALGSLGFALPHAPPEEWRALARVLVVSVIENALADLARSGEDSAEPPAPGSLRATFHFTTTTSVGIAGRRTRSRGRAHFHAGEAPPPYEQSLPPLERCTEGTLPLPDPDGPFFSAGELLLSDAGAWRDLGSGSRYAFEGALSPGLHELAWCGSDVIATGGVRGFRVHEPSVREPVENTRLARDQPLRIRWTPVGAAHTTIVLSGPTRQLTCHVDDDGEFEVSAEQVDGLRGESTSGHVILSHWDIVDAPLPGGGSARVHVQSAQRINLAFPPQ